MKATVKIVQRPYKTKEGQHQICLRYTAYRRTTFIGLNISINPKHWNDKRKTVLSGDPSYFLYNEIIEKQHLKAKAIILDNLSKPLSVPEFVNRFNDKYYGSTDFYLFVESQFEHLGLLKSKSTISKFHSLINTLRKWRPVLSFNEITLEFIHAFHNYEMQSGHTLMTIYKKHSNLKFLINLAIEKKILQDNPYCKFPIKKITKAQNNDVLTEDELRILQNVYLNNNYSKGRKEVLRNFLFSCYTSLSYAEFRKVIYNDLNPVVLKENKTVYYLLKNKRTKTNVTYKIPIVSPIVIELLELEGKESFQNIFNPLSNSYTNLYLKQIMRDLGINKDITFHRARHSFRTIAAKRGIRDLVAERIMGHSEGNDIRDIYTHLQDEDIVTEMKEKWFIVDRIADTQISTNSYTYYI